MDSTDCCGKLCCADCFVGHLERQRTLHLENNPNWTSSRNRAWTSQDEIKRHPEQLRNSFQVLNLLYDGPEFTCPMCNQRVGRPPPVSRANLRLVKAVAEAKNEVDPRNDPEWAAQRDAYARNMWRPFFGY